MEIKGQRICIAGSASPDFDSGLLTFAQAVVSRITERIVRESAMVVTGIGREPLLNPRAQALPLIFDWTVLGSVWAERGRLTGGMARPSNPPACVVATHKTARQIPKHRKKLWNNLTEAGLLDIRYVKSGWTAGALRRQLQAELADVLILIGGGQGVEHLATEFAAQNKPIIPLDIQIGASCEDGRGAPALFQTLRDKPEKLLPLSRKERVGAMVNRIVEVLDNGWEARYFHKRDYYGTWNDSELWKDKTKQNKVLQEIESKLARSNPSESTQ